jgi:hypothetical protein
MEGQVYGMWNPPRPTAHPVAPAAPALLLHCQLLLLLLLLLLMV